MRSQKLTIRIGQNILHAQLHLLARYDDVPFAGKGIQYAFKQPNDRRTGISGL